MIRQTHRRGSLAAALLLILGSMLAALSRPAAQVHGASLDKKSCHTVTKKVHGMKKKVKVCHAVKKATPTPTATSTATTVPGDVRAQQLADAASHAPDQAGTEAGIRAIFAAIGIPVVSPAGTVEQAGTSHLYAYDIETTALAAALRAGTMTSLDDVAARLTALHVQGPNGAALTGPSLQQALIATVQAALASPTDPSQIVPLLLRALGRDHQTPYDLAAAPTTFALDPLQVFLLEANFLGPLVDQTASMHDLLRSRDDCAIQLEGKGGLWSHVIDLVETSVGVTPSDVQLLHQDAIAQAIQVQPLDPSVQVSHFGPGGPYDPDPAAGKDLTLGVRVVQTAPIPEPGVDIDCGAIAGAHIPPQGPVQGANVRFARPDPAFASGGTLDPFMSEVTEDSFTNGQGEARDVWRMDRSEPLPGIGPEVTVAEGAERAEVMTGFSGSDFTKGAFTLSSPPLRWRITAHRPRGYMFDNLVVKETYTFQSPGGSATTSSISTISGHFCGEDPYSGPWQLTVHHEYTGADPQSVTLPVVVDFDETSKTGDVLTSDGKTPFALVSVLGIWGAGDVRYGGPPDAAIFLYAGPPRVQIETEDYSGGILHEGSGDTTVTNTPVTQTVSAPIVEDPDCPPLSP